MRLIKMAAMVAAICTIVACKNGTTTNEPSGERKDAQDMSTPLNGGSAAPQENSGSDDQANGNAAPQNHAGVGYDSATDGKTGGGSIGKSMPDSSRKRR